MCPMTNGGNFLRSGPGSSCDFERARPKRKGDEVTSSSAAQALVGGRCAAVGYRFGDAPTGATGTDRPKSWERERWCPRV